MADADSSWNSTLSLLARAKAGDTEALDDLFARYLPLLRRWARGRLPVWARDVSDTQDLVQDTLLQTFKKIDGFEHRGEGAFQAYLRQAVMNRIRDSLRSAHRRPASEALDEEAPDTGLSPLEMAMGSEALAQYDAALDRLPEDDRALIVARIELGLSYSEVAAATGKATPNAARMAVSRALVKLAQEIRGPDTVAR
ncbi:MAG: sigma-70 family RNA polymerase sigma factor [Vicinamibacterales bacterium]